ncbi:hypothetical protein E4U17_003353 [Claviceps sp. LM77 group G4]|nr:hypothetical protein E4U17_003353 [Claviceps sp. LM77 group G4]KAG6067024.1 hypothetical protein E4U16_000152 [Claviceps sp. LM84 group G4]KAG6075090.1 hypothetical protein E4U33_002188 [Claviceps sp. LM78 group G4]
MTKPPTSLDETYSSLLARRALNNRLRTLTLPSPNTIDFSSNGYLSLSSHPVIKQQYLARLAQDPLPLLPASTTTLSLLSQTHQQTQAQTFSLGSCGSRLLDGNSPLAEALEHEIAAFHGAPAALLFNSGFEANTGLFGCAPQEGDVVVYDELIHASVHDGVKLSRGKGVAFAHNCVRKEGRFVEDGLPSLEEVLERLERADCEDVGEEERADDDEDASQLNDVLAEGSARTKNRIRRTRRTRRTRRNIFIAVESVYSMDGDLAPLQDIVGCVEACLPHGNGYIVVDEAHSTGWMGDKGRGMVSTLGLEDRIWARVHTFGKAMGCAGAAVLCSPPTRAYLINYARSLIYTTALGFPLLTAIQTAYDFLSTGQATPLARNLLALTSLAHQLLSALSTKYRPPACLLRVPTEAPASPIVPLFSDRARSLARYCQERGFVLRAIVAPTVKKGTDRVRLCLHAANTVDEVRSLCLAVESWLREELGDVEGVAVRVPSGEVVNGQAGRISACSKL